MRGNGISLLLLLLLSLLIFSCKTQEQIEREKLVDNLNVQMVDSQRLNADTTLKLQQLEDRISQITGQVEETGHHNRQSFEQKIQTLNQQVIALEESNKNLDKRVAELQTKTDEQSEYLKQVLKSLDNLAKPKAKKRTAKKKKSSPYQIAMANYKRGSYSRAKKQLQDLLDGSKVKGNRKARVLHNLGMIEHIQKQDSKAVDFFVRLLSEHPKSPYNKNGLLFLAKTFQRQKKIDEAKATLNQLITQYPKAKQVKDAKKILSKL